MEKIKKSFCRICDTFCGINIFVKDGVMVNVEGMKEHPLNQGTLCAKGNAGVQIMYSPQRLNFPLKRVGERGQGKWARISWDEALKIIAVKLQELKKKYGAWALAWDQGRGPAPPHFARLMNLYGTPNGVSRAHICHAPRVMNYRYTYGDYAIGDVSQSNLTIQWGIHWPYSSAGSLRPYSDALRRGIKLIVVDPLLTSMAAKADLWLQIRPGTDGALALSMINVIITENLYDKGFVENWTMGFDRLSAEAKKYPPEVAEKITWVPAEKIRQAARLYATIKPASIDVGNGVDDHTNTSQTVRAISSLIAISGNLDVRGGNIFIPWLNLKDIFLWDAIPPEEMTKRIGGGQYPLFERFTRMTSYPYLIHAILQNDPYAPKALMVMKGNPMATLANSNLVEKAFRKLDFIVVNELVMTETAKLADIVLPGGSHYEAKGICLYQAHHTTYPPSLPPYLLMSDPVNHVLERRSDLEILFELAEHLGFKEQFWGGDIERSFDDQLSSLGISVKDLKEHPSGMSIPISIKERKFETKGFRTPSKKVEFYSETYEKYGYPPVPVYEEPEESPISQPELAIEFPMILASRRTPLYVHSGYRWVPWLREWEPEATVMINPKTAKDLGISEGEEVILESKRGSCSLIATLSPGVHPKIVHVLHGWSGKGNINRLTDNEHRDPIMSCCPLKSSLCRVVKKTNVKHSS
jgi:anaerobic selenocysteine-containing dehydrogenase